ncbi:MAG: O-antigen ligase family protein [Parcubacteria group bacterium]|nr:O-antigen ligase family protein [Parcubacteria group bacterium]
MLRYISSKTIFLIELIIVPLVALGILDRHWAFLLLLFWVIFIFKHHFGNLITLFIQSIPLFIALPITPNFDNFNIWRIIAGLIFLKWFFQRYIILNFFNQLVLVFKKPVLFFREHKISSLIILLFIICVLSVFVAPDKFAAIKRIIYFANILIIPTVIYFEVKRGKLFYEKILKVSLIAGAIAVMIGFIQLGMTYFMDPDSFLKFWALKIDTNLYGFEWGKTALNANTWFAYFGEKLVLRMFSSFPDSHSFPMFLIMTLPGLFYIKNTIKNSVSHVSSLMFQVLCFVFLLAIVLTGTRGIWLAFLGPILLTIYYWVKGYKEYAKLGGKLIIIFLIAFGLTYFIFSTAQFKVHGGLDLINTRIKSLLDASELSNSGRILIWKATLESIKKHPLLGVGIGNFPVVLNQKIELAKAGSSAHNLYLNFLAEIGIIGGLLFMWLFWLIFRKIYTYLKQTQKLKNSIQTSTHFYFLISYVWVLLYSLTDAALTDERSFLMFTSMVTLNLAILNKKSGIDPDSVN